MNCLDAQGFIIFGNVHKYSWWKKRKIYSHFHKCNACKKYIEERGINELELDMSNGDVSLPILIERLLGKNEPNLIIEEIGRRGDPSALLALIEYINKSSASEFDVAIEALLAMGNMGQPAVDYLIKTFMCGTTNPNDRIERQCWNYPGLQGKDFLLFDYERDMKIRKYAAVSLENIGSSAISDLSKTITSSSPIVKLKSLIVILSHEYMELTKQSVILGSGIKSLSDALSTCADIMRGLSQEGFGSNDASTIHQFIYERGSIADQLEDIASFWKTIGLNPSIEQRRKIIYKMQQLRDKWDNLWNSWFRTIGGIGLVMNRWYLLGLDFNSLKILALDVPVNFLVEKQTLLSGS